MVWFPENWDDVFPQKENTQSDQGVDEASLRANSKGKSKILTQYAFNEDGLLSKDAINIIDSGRLLSVSKCFGKVVIDLEEEIFDGIYANAKDILDCAVRGSLDSLLGSIRNSKVKAKGIRIKDAEAKVEKFSADAVSSQDEVMEVDEAIMEWALYEQASMGLLGK